MDKSHFSKLDNTIKEVDSMILASTLLLVEAWNHGLAEGLPHGKNSFDEAIEQMWIKQWLFYGNSIKYASAMIGAPDYATFKNGWWNLSENLQQMKDWIEFKKKAKHSKVKWSKPFISINGEKPKSNSFQCMLGKFVKSFYPFCHFETLDSIVRKMI